MKTAAPEVRVLQILIRFVAQQSFDIMPNEGRQETPPRFVTIDHGRGTRDQFQKTGMCCVLRICVLARGALAHDPRTSKGLLSSLRINVDRLPSSRSRHDGDAARPPGPPPHADALCLRVPVSLPWSAFR